MGVESEKASLGVASGHKNQLLNVLRPPLLLRVRLYLAGAHLLHPAAAGQGTGPALLCVSLLPSL